MESLNKMSLHNLATVFGPTLLRPSEKDGKTSHVSLSDSWSLEVMAQVRAPSSGETGPAAQALTLPVSTGPGSSLLPAAGKHSHT